MCKRLFTCEKCGHEVTDDEACYDVENNHCEACVDAYQAEQAAYWWPLYQGEKTAGLIEQKED